MDLSVKIKKVMYPEWIQAYDEKAVALISSRTYSFSLVGKDGG